jgi:chitodextrinase
MVGIMQKIRKPRWLAAGSLLVLLPVLAAAAILGGKPALAAACVQSTDYGQASGSVNLPAAATYRVWSRIMVPDTTNTTYLLQINDTCYTVGGGSSLQANTWVWVAHQNGDANAKINISLAAGNLSYKAIGNKPGVKLDRIVFSSDLNCVPTGDGANCNTPSDTQTPTVKVTSPVNSGKVSGSVSLAATATDNTSVSKVEFYVNSALVKTSTAQPHSYQWDTTAAANGSYLLTAKAFDTAGNTSSDSVTVTVENGDKEAPTTPTNLQAKATAYNKVTLSWGASTDNTAVTSYIVYRDTVPVATLGNVTSYIDTVNANTTYAYKVQALDKAGNKSTATAAVSVQTPAAPDTQAPSAPGNVQAQVVNQSQINVSWTGSTDNIGVTGYDVYRAKSGGTPAKIATVTGTSYGDTGLGASTDYSYYVIAKDGSNNQSQASSTVNVTTAANETKRKRSVIKGNVSGESGRRISYAIIVLTNKDTGKKQIFQADRNGNYRATRLEAGTYEVKVRALGYRSASLTVKVAESALVTKDIKLQR